MEWNIKLRKGILVSRRSVSSRPTNVLESETNPQDTEIAKGEIDPARTSIMGSIVLWAQDKKDDKRNMILECLGRSLGECSIVVDWDR